MTSREPRTLSRDVEVAAIPYGDKITLTSGTTVYITQALGGSYTAMTDHGYLVRIEGTDADAIGEEPTKPLSAEEVAGRSIEEVAWDQLKGVFDPEIPVNIVDLGLVYGWECDDAGAVQITMTLTAPGCGMGPVIAADAQSRIMTLEEVDDAKVELVWDPPWNQEMISEEGRMKLGMV